MRRAKKRCGPTYSQDYTVNRNKILAVDSLIEVPPIFQLLALNKINVPMPLVAFSKETLSKLHENLLSNLDCKGVQILILPIFDVERI